MQLKLFPDEPPMGVLPTNLTANRHPIHRWFNFIAGFSPEFVKQCIDNANLKPGEVVIDPFAGVCTTLVEAMIRSVPSVGFEPHPFFYDVACAKLNPPTSRSQVDELELLARTVDPIMGRLTDVWTEDASTYLAKLIPEDSLRSLAAALLIEEGIPEEQRPLYRLILSRALELTATSQTDGVYKAPTSIKRAIGYVNALRKVCDEIREDICYEVQGLRAPTNLFPMSSEDMTPIDNSSCSLCITSPPYLNNFDFAEMTRMELYFWRYAGSWSEITNKVRRRLIVNTTTAPTDLKRDQTRFSAKLSPAFLEHVQPIVQELEQRSKLRAGRKDYHLLVYPYFAQMLSVLRELQRTLRQKSPLHVVVADAALYGVHIKTHILLAHLMVETGFEVLESRTLRSRGTRWELAKRQGANLGEFHIHARRA